MGLYIRPFAESDYPALVDVLRALDPDCSEGELEWREWDARRDPRTRAARWVATVAGAVVGWAGYSQDPWLYEPHQFELELSVRPEHQGRGIGAALYGTLVDSLRPHAPRRYYTWTRAEYARSLRFLEARGFRETMREWESSLPLAEFDPGPFAGWRERLAESGIAIRTLRELAADPDHERKLYALECAVQRDIPATLEVTPAGFDWFVRSTLRNPRQSPDAWFVAVRDGEYLGYSNLLQATGDPSVLVVGATGTAPAYRRRGVALGVKLAAVEYARRISAREIRTGNATTNTGMLALNAKLGFRRRHVALEYRKELEEPAPAG